jgi:GTPase
MTKCGHIAIIGRPNAGKSTLLNAILGEHISIVTPKPQTTRKRVLGIYTDDTTQLIFIDTPGVLKPKYRMQHAMMGYVTDTLAEADVVCVIVDAEKAVERGTALDPMITPLLSAAKGTPVVLVLNKMDAVPVKKEVLPLIEEARLSGLFVRSVAISASENKEVDALVGYLKDLVPEGEFIYERDQLSTLPQRFFVAELIREAIFKQYREEIPYATDVNIIEFEEHEDTKWHITADITVERDSQKGILIGKKGEALKQIGIAARESIERHLGQEIFLELFVKVRTDWRDDRSQLLNLGY